MHTRHVAARPSGTQPRPARTAPRLCLCLCSKLGSQRFGGLVFTAFRDADLETKSVAMYKEVGVGDRMGTLSREQFAELLQKIAAENQLAVIALSD